MSILNNGNNGNNLQATIDTVVPTLSVGQIQISADRRSTKEKPLTDSERIRRVVLPADFWGSTEATLNNQKSQSLTDILREALKAIAADRLREQLNENPLQRTVELKDFSVPSLLSWSSESASSRGSITFSRDQATNWFTTSHTAAAMLAKHGEVKGTAILNLLTNRFGALAAKNHGLKDEAEALKLASIIDANDLDGAEAVLVSEILSRLDHIAKALKAKAAEATTAVSLDDI